MLYLKDEFRISAHEHVSMSVFRPRCDICLDAYGRSWSYSNRNKSAARCLWETKRHIDRYRSWETRAARLIHTLQAGKVTYRRRRCWIQNSDDTGGHDTSKTQRLIITPIFMQLHTQSQRLCGLESKRQADNCGRIACMHQWYIDIFRLSIAPKNSPTLIRNESLRSKEGTLLSHPLQNFMKDDRERVRKLRREKRRAISQSVLGADIIGWKEGYRSEYGKS